MAWGGSGWYGDTIKLAIGGSAIALDLESETALKLALYDNTITPNYSAATPAYSATGEIAGTGYTAGGMLLTLTTLAVSAGFLAWDADNAEWTASTLTGVRGAIAYNDTLAGNNLIIGVDFTTTYATADGSLIVSWHANGIGRFNVVAA